MASYLALCLRIDARGASPFTASQRTNAVTPVVLGASSSLRDVREDVFVAGFAIEDFMCRSVRTECWEPGSIHIASRPTEAVAYLEQRIAAVDVVKGLDVDRNAFSPFEARHPSVPLSVMPAPLALDEDALAEFAGWQASHSDATAFMLYAIDIAAADGEWLRCLRWLSDKPGRLQPAGNPLLLMRSARSRAEPTMTEIMIHTSTPVWLRDAPGFAGRIPTTAADENLTRLAALCATFADHPGLVSATLAIEGRDFVAQEGRLRGALERSLGRALPPAF